MALPTFLARYEKAGIQQSGGLLTGWQDSSGNGHHITTSAAPAVISLSGKTIVRFDGSNYLTLPSSLGINSQSLSFYAVVRGDSASARMLFSPGSGGDVASLYFTGGGNVTVFDGDGKDTGLRPGNVNRYLVGMRCNATNTRVIMGAETAAVTACAAQTGTGGEIGRFTGNSGLYYVGDIEAIFICASAITDSEEASLRDHCVANYKVGSADPEIAVVFEGNSETEGWGLATPWTDHNLPRKFCEQYESEPKVWSIATSGETAQQMVGQGATADAILPFMEAFTRRIAYLWAGTNDFHENSASAVDVAGYASTWRTDRLTSGFNEVWFCTPLPRNGSISGFETRRQALVALVAADPGWADRLIRVDQNADIGLDGCQNDLSLYQADGIHLAEAGVTTKAGVAKQAISPALEEPPTITSATTASGTVGSAFSYTITATGTAPITYGATGLPSGLGLNTSTGAITGTPTGAGTSVVTLSATNDFGADTETLTITISAGVATGYTITPASGIRLGAGARFVVSATPAGTAWDGTFAITVTDSAAGGTFTPTIGTGGTGTMTVTPPNGTQSFEFVYTTSELRTFTFANNKSWSNQANLTFQTTTANPVNGRLKLGLGL